MNFGFFINRKENNKIHIFVLIFVAILLLFSNVLISCSKSNGTESSAEERIDKADVTVRAYFEGVFDYTVYITGFPVNVLDRENSDLRFYYSKDSGTELTDITDSISIDCEHQI